MDQENTTTVETPGGHTVVLIGEMTGRIYRELKGMWFKDVIIEGVDSENPDNTKISGMKGTIMQEVENKAIELTVISVDGSTEKVMDKLVDLPLEDYNVVIQKINEMTQDLGQKKTD